LSLGSFLLYSVEPFGIGDHLHPLFSCSSLQVIPFLLTHGLKECTVFVGSDDFGVLFLELGYTGFGLG
jgi:hypothetical protein